MRSPRQPATGDAMLQPASYKPGAGDFAAPSPLAPNLTVIHKTMGEEGDDDEEDLAELLEGSELKTVKVGRGDTLAGLITKAGSEPTRPKPSSRPWSRYSRPRT